MRHVSLIFNFLALILLFIPFLADAQGKAEPENFASPNAASLGVYGNIGVNFFTGSPDISVPLHQVTEGEIKIPISLNYSTSRVKPNEHPGMFGLGWSVSCLGQITRIQKGLMDEQRLTNFEAPYKYVGFYYNYKKLDTAIWASKQGFEMFVRGMTTDRHNYEVNADEFAFNFLGYSGRFQLGHDGKWHVQCDSDIKVIFNEEDGFLNHTDIRNSIWVHMDGRKAVEYTDKFFNKFTLITPDGTRYTFGGKDATEYSTDFRQRYKTPIVPTTWYLSQIKTIQNKVVNLYYSEGPLICTLSHGYGYSRRYRPDDKNWILNSGCTSINKSIERSPADGFLIFPVYLDSIKSSLETVVFNHSTSNELRYFDYDMDFHAIYDKIDDDPQTNDRQIYSAYFYLNSQLQWQKLDTIKIKYADNQLLKKFEFNYTNSENTRLKLLSIQEIDKNGISKPPYQFSYKPSSFQHYCSDRVDHWGYNNAFDTTNARVGNTIIEFINVYNKIREPDTTGVFCQSELLDTLRYPTSGFTVFEFEPHTYSKVVNKDRISFATVAKDKYAGGVRIKRISSFADKSALPIVKEYLYKSNFIGAPNSSLLPSSGVLAGLYQYSWFNYFGKDMDGASFDYDLFSSGSLFPSSINSQGSHIGYSQVVEIVPQNGYSIYSFTNYDTKVGDNYPHLDESAVYLSEGRRSVFSPYTSKEMERGKLLKLQVHNKFNQMVREASYGYTRSSDSYQRQVHWDYINICTGNNASAGIYYATAFKKYDYSYLLTSEVEQTFPTDDPGNKQRVLSNQTVYEYNFNKKLVKATIKSQSDSSKIITYNSYPFDYENVSDTVDVYLKLMVSDTVHFINSLVSQEIFKKHINGNTEIIGGKIFRYGKNYLPISIFNLEIEISTNRSYTSYSNHPPSGHSILIPTDLPYKKVGELQYDSFGNISEMKQPSQPTISYIWSYNHLFQVAKIVNATNQEIASALGYNNYKALSSALGNTYTDVNRNKVNSLRTLISKTRVTSATYDTLLGINSLTDENGNSLYYIYDNFNRPQLIKDNDQNIIKSFRYNYKTNP